MQPSMNIVALLNYLQTMRFCEHFTHGLVCLGWIELFQMSVSGEKQSNHVSNFSIRVLKASRGVLLYVSL